MNSLYAIIAEGEAERAILDILLDSGKLDFTRKQILEDRVLKTRSGKNFCEKHLNFNFKQTIKVYRILDSRGEKFKLPREYQSKIESINVITRPEIEILVIISEGRYKEYKNSGLKPSVFAAKNIKGFKKYYEYYISYYKDVNKLIDAINEYKRITKLDKDEICLSSLIK